MKNLIKVAAIAAFTAIAFNNSAQAQSLNASESMEARARILRQIQIANVTSLNFGAVEAQRDIYLDPKAQTNNSFVGTRAALGRFTIVASDNEVLELVIPSDVTLTRRDPNNLANPVSNPTSDDRINFIPAVTIKAAADQTAAAGQAPNAADFLLSREVLTAPTGDITGDQNAPNGVGNGTVYYRTGTTGWATMFVGGRLRADGSTTVIIPSSQNTGTYVGTLTVTASYYTL